MNNNDKNSAAIFSLRIVSIDSYMKAPLFGLDSCYSEFRGEQVKQVPVIRIFGTDANGTKTCAHIHGVFPYLYVPYGGGGDSTTDTDRLSYQLASSLDKAINISLGQSSATAQHVFKIILVKAKPFYGYHKSVHKFLKIFFYNPAFIRRAANLLQNGAILGQVFQPHESHVPYILQFMIDYNLYGMSFLYIPNKTVRYRQRTMNTSMERNMDDDDFDDVLKNIDANQILDGKIERMSTSAQEIDINSTVILNRFQVAMNDEENEHANPGIAFLWSDERGRRSKMQNNPPPLIVTQECTQDRGVIPPTDSELFHQAALDRRLEQFATDTPSTQSSDSSRIFDQTLNRSDANRKFNLNQFLQNSIYPMECSQNEGKSSNERQSILNASFQIDHLKSSKPMSHRSSNDSSSMRSQQFDPNDTVVDEELILNLTQKASNTTLLNETLNENEHEVLDIFELLEEDEPSHDETLRIDDDSVLAQLSQATKDPTDFSQPKQQQTNNSDAHTTFEEEDSDDDLLNQFSMSIIDCLPDEHGPADEIKIPQFDGAIDSPTKKSALKKGAQKPNNRSPSKSTKKYAPLDIVITKSPAVHNDAMLHRIRPIQLKEAKICLEKCDASHSMLSKTFTVPKSSSDAENEQSIDISSSSSSSADFFEDPIIQKPTKIEESCNSNTKVPNKYQEIMKKSPVIKLIKYENIEKAFNMGAFEHQLNEYTMNLRKRNAKDDITNKRFQRSACENDMMDSTPERESSSPVLERRYPKRNRKPRTDLTDYHIKTSTSKESKRKKSSTDDDDDDDLGKLDMLYSWYKWSDCKISQRYDKERNFYPQPGPSNLNYYEDDDLTGYYKPVKVKESATRSNRLLSKRANEKRSTETKTKERKTSEVHKDSLIVKGLLSPSFSNDSDWENDIQVQSFYEQSCRKRSILATQNRADELSPISLSPEYNETSGEINGAPNMNTTLNTPMMTKFLESIKMPTSEEKPRTMQRASPDRCTIQFKNIPSRTNIKQVLNSHQLPKVVHPIPFYSDPNDILAEGSKKEIGHTILQLNGNAVNDCDEFESQLNINGMVKWQSLIAHQSQRGLRARDKKSHENGINVRGALAKQILVRTKPASLPPNREQAKKWLKMRAKTNDIKRTAAQLNNHDRNECPAKIRRENGISNKNTSKPIDSIHETQTVKQNGFKEDAMNKLLSKPELTIRRITRQGTKQITQLFSNDENHVQYPDENNDDSNDDVIFMSETLPTNRTNDISFGQLVGYTK